MRVKNLVELTENPADVTRDQVLLRSLVSAHTLLGVIDGQFVSLLEPPENFATSPRSARTSEPGQCWSAKQASETP